MVREMARDFARNEIAPIAAQMDEQGHLDPGLIPKMAELGFWGIPWPEEYSGAGMDVMSYIIAVEEISRVCGSTGITLAAHTSLGTYPIAAFGTEEQKKKFLPPLCSGEYLGAMGLTEPGAGSDAGGTKTVAIRNGSDWILNGTKTFITNSEYAGSFVIAASTDPPAKTHGITAFIHERDIPGFRVGKHENKLGLRGSSTTELIYEDCRIPDSQRLGEVNKGFKVFMKTLDGGRISIGALALGIAQGAFNEALKYSQEREQFDQPICNFQGVQWMLAESATKLEAARHMVYHAARLYSRGESYHREAAMAKLFAAVAGREVCNDALQIHGGYGYIKEFPVERMYRDIKLCEIGEGTNEIHKMVIARSLIKDGYPRHDFE
ncbi:MAG: acyl-CoA dehydrogenase [bacterium]|nr:acyl-CoA dehydrogenase [bacterium]